MTLIKITKNRLKLREVKMKLTKKEKEILEEKLEKPEPDETVSCTGRRY